MVPYFLLVVGQRGEWTETGGAGSAGDARNKHSTHGVDAAMAKLQKGSNPE
jgi:hypothetical protein